MRSGGKPIDGPRPSCVKIYLCSNPEDSVEERRALRDTAFPRLREQCRHSTGLELIDPFESRDPGRWPDENSRRELIRACRESSAGPFLLTLIGHQYGPASLPTRVEVSEYQLLLHQGQRAGLGTQELEAEYQRDENSIPASYVRTPSPRHTRCPPADDGGGGEKETRGVFHAAVSLSVQSGLMSPERGQHFYRSALDADLRFALDDCPDENLAGRCLVYVNKVVNAKGRQAKQQLQPHVQALTSDTVLPTTAPTDGDLLLSELCDTFLPEAVTARQLLVYTTTTECDPRHGYTTTRRRGYAESLSQQVYCDLVRLTDGLNIPERREDTLRRERAEQGELCDLLSGLYELSQPEEEQVRAYVEQRGQQRPLVVTGGPCTGKTVLVAHCTQEVRSWCTNSDPVVIGYLCSLSSDSSPKHLLSSLCSQIADRYHTSSSGQDPGVRLHTNQADLSCSTNAGELESSCSATSALQSHHGPGTDGQFYGPDLNQGNKTYLDPKELHSGLLQPDICLSDLKELLLSLLTLLPSEKQPLVLLLDGLDQLENSSGSQIVQTLPSPLPPHVKLILAVSRYRTCLLLAVELHYPPRGAEDSACQRVQLGRVDRKQCVQMLTLLLRRSGRRVTSGQQVLVNQALTCCGLPLYVRLLHAHTSLWRSDSDVTDSSLPNSVHSSISALLDLLAHKHGSSLVERAVSVLTLSRVGLAEPEFADLLCRHNGSEVAQVDVERLLLDLRSFLVMRTAAGSQVLQWVSRHFKLVVAKRFLGGEEVRREIHTEMAGYFSGCRLHGGDESNRRDAFASHVDKPSSQTFGFTAFGDAGQVSSRRVVELPHHLKQSGKWEDLESGLLMSLNYHQAMVQAGLLAELAAMLESCEDSPRSEFLRERLLLASILKSSACFLRSSPLQLCAVMESGLLPYLEVFPALKGYVRDVRLDRRRRGSGLGISLCPSPSSVLPLQYLKLNNKTKDLRVTEAAVAGRGVVAQVLSDGSAFIWKGCGGALAKLSLTWEESELKFAGAKSSGELLLLATQCHKLFVCVAAGPETFQKIQVPLRPESESSQTLNKIQGFVACQKKLLMWRKDERYVSVFDRQSETTTYLQCPSSVTCVVVSSDCRCAYCGQDEGTVSIFDLESSNLIGSCSNTNHSEVASIILREEDDLEMACVDRSGSVALWGLAAKTQPPRLVKEICSRKSNEILGTDYSPETETLVVCEADQVTLYDTCNWELWDQFLAPQSRAFSHALLSQDGHLLLALLETCTLVLVWRITSGECVLSLETNKRPHALLKTTTDFICVARDGSLTAWDSEMIAAAGTTPKMKCGVKALAVEPKGKWFYTADGSERVWRWRLESNLPHAHFLHDGPVEKLLLSPNGVHLVSLSAGEIYVWQLESGDNVVRIGGSRATNILITPNSHFGVSISERGLSRVWRLAHGSIVCSIHLYLSDAQVSPEGTFLIGRRSGDLVAANLWSGSISKRFSCVEGSERVVAFHTISQHPDHVLVMAASGAVYTWNVAEETACRHFQLPETFRCRPQDFQMSSDSSYALLSTDNDSINLLDLSQVRLCTFRSDGRIIKACLDKNGRFAVYVSQPSSLEGSCICFLHTRPVLTVVRLSDGETIGSVSLAKSPLTVVVRGQRVFVGLEDGSVAVYSVFNVNENELLRSRGDSNGQGKQSLHDKDLPCCFPRASATVTWS